MSDTMLLETKGDTNNNTMTNGETKSVTAESAAAAATTTAESSSEKTTTTTTVAQNAESENNKQEETTTAQKSTDNELILIQDNAFSIKISVPGLDVFDLQVTSMELVQEINQMLMDKEETCHRTCFSLQLDGVTLDNFSELKSIEGLKDGSLVKLIDEPYTVREVRLHVRHISDLMHSMDAIENFNAVNCNSLTYVNEITSGDITDKRGSKAETSNDFLPSDYVFPQAKDTPLVPLHLNAAAAASAAATAAASSSTAGSNKQQQQNATTNSNNKSTNTCLKQLVFSGWNPPPGKRKMHGDLMYLHVITNEDKRYHLTASVKGFFVNQSTDDVFNPKQDNSHKLCHSLVDLLNTLSPSFKKNFSAIQKKRTSKHPFERIGTPFQVFSWLSPEFEHTVDWFRAEDSNASKLGHEDHIPGHSRDWNEEIQATKELPKKTLPERLIRERAMFKVHSDFVNAATRGAIAVVESNILAINPGEDSKIQMFIWNNMFFSLGFDVKDHYKEFGGDYAAYVAPINDLQGVKALNALDIDGLYTLGTVVVDYRGYRVTVQSIIPGILDKDQEQSVVHGSTDFGKTCATNPKYNELLEKVCANLRMRPHKIKIENKDEIVLYSSVECKGIVGNDSRHYILDLLRMFPPDLNYLAVEDNKLDSELNKLSFPRKFRHKLCCLRPELIESFVDFKYIQFIKYAALQAQQLNKKSEDTIDQAKEGTVKDLEEAKKLVKELQTGETKAEEEAAIATTTAAATEEKEKEESKPVVTAANSLQIIADACAHVQSWKSNEFDMRFHPNLYQPVCQLADDAETLSKDAQLLTDACKYLVCTQIPGLIRDLAEHSIYLVDGAGLVETMHVRGINVRYLGYLAQLIEKNESASSLAYVHSIAVNELISRCAKRVFRSYIQSVSTLNMSQAVAHFLNCYLSNYVKQLSNSSTTSSTLSSTTPASNNSTQVNGVGEEKETSTAVVAAGKKKKRNQKKNNRNILQDQFNNDWMNLTFRSLWAQIAEEAQTQYHYDIKLESSEESSFGKMKARKVTLLRSFCQKNGVQMLLREYNMESKHKEAFGEDDVINMYPVVKHVAPKASDAYNFFTNGQAKIQQGFLKEGFELISESYNLLTNVYGALHPEICMCLRLLARLNYILGDYAEAMSTQHKAVMMCERLLGVDSSQAITEYTHLSLYCFANGQIANSLKLLYRARYLLLLNFGEDHPEMSLIDSNLGLILQAACEYDCALKFLEKALECNRKYFGAKSMKTALSYHLLARLQSCRGDFRTALMNERETYQIYKSLLGEEHDRTRESAQVLKHLTEQAVLLQKRVNEMYKVDKTGGASSGAAGGDNKSSMVFPPIQIQQPSLQTVLAMLNIINGIIFIPSSHEEEYDRIRDELNRIQLQQQQQQQQQQSSESAEAPKINSQDDDLQ